jgi:hypothetical protein
MSKSKKYKTFAELKGSVVSSRVSENRIAEMITDLDDFVKKIPGIIQKKTCDKP